MIAADSSLRRSRASPGRIRRPLIGAQLIESDGQDAEHLADVIVQLAPDAASLLFLGMDQPAGELFELGGPLAHLQVELVVRLLERALRPPPPRGDEDNEGGDKGEGDDSRQVREVERQVVERRGEVIVDRQRGQRRAQERRPETGEPRGRQDRNQQNDRRVQHRLQPQGDADPDQNGQDGAAVLGQGQHPACTRRSFIPQSPCHS